MRIYIIGYMYSGKTTVGKRLAASLGYPFIDTDILFEKKYHISISDFFSKYDEKAFRIIEQEILFSTKKDPDAVISIGGGTPCTDENINFIINNGLSIYLKADISTILSRLKSSLKSRPLLDRISNEDLPSFIEEHLKERSHFYNRAEIIYPAENVHIPELRERIEIYLFENKIKKL